VTLIHNAAMASVGRILADFTAQTGVPLGQVFVYNVGDPAASVTWYVQESRRGPGIPALMVGPIRVWRVEPAGSDFRFELAPEPTT
jgi:hypothetical protein